MGVIAYIGLGSNLGNREGFIRQAIEWMAKTSGIRVIKVSSLVETKPIGPQNQPDFLNGVASIETRLTPIALLDCLQAMEDKLGRVREGRWGPRTIDLDILLYGDETIDLPRLKVPHPEIKNRPFVQEALKELGASKKGEKVKGKR